MRHSVDFWDTGEMQTVPWILGIAHPTGFPTFVLGGYIFSHLIPIGSVAFRMSLFSGLAMSGAAWLLFLTARELEVEPRFALLCAWIFATTELAWSRGTRTEVHALAIAAAAGVLYLTVRFARRQNLRTLLWLELLAGIGIGVHPVIIFALLPAILVVAADPIAPYPNAAALQRFRGLKLGWVLGAGVSGALVSALLYAYIPLRSAWLYAARRDPTLSLGLPAGRPYWDYGHPADVAGFWREVSGSDFTVGGGMLGLLHGANYAQIPSFFLAPTAAEIGWVMVLAAGVGIIGMAQKTSWLATISFLSGGIFALVFAASYTSESDVARYFLIALWLLLLYSSVGCQRIATWVVQVTQRLNTKYFRHAPFVVECLISVVLLNALAGNLRVHGPRFLAQPAEVGAEPFIERVVAVTPSNAIIIANWAYATPLAYAAYVDHRLAGRIIETAWPADDAAYVARWRTQRPVVIVDPGVELPATITGVTSLDHEAPRLLLVRSTSMKARL